MTMLVTMHMNNGHSESYDNCSNWNVAGPKISQSQLHTLCQKTHNFRPWNVVISTYLFAYMIVKCHYMIWRWLLMCVFCDWLCKSYVKARCPYCILFRDMFGNFCDYILNIYSHGTFDHITVWIRPTAFYERRESSV